MTAPFFTDLRLRFANGAADIEVGPGEQGMVRGLDNLVQALTLRLLIDRGELSGLGHPRHGTRVRDLLGQTMDRANLELLRRYVRQALRNDPRVDDVLSVTVTPRGMEPGVVEVSATVRAVRGGTATVQAVLNA
jgi:phage baseplate assembly protein W